MAEPDFPPARRHTIRTEHIRSLLAVAVVLGGGAFLVSMWHDQGTRDPGAFVSAVVAMISGVLGYYFGSEGTERAQRVANDEIGRSRQLEAGATQVRATAAVYRSALNELHREAVRANVILDALAADPATRDKVDELARRMDGEDP